MATKSTQNDADEDKKPYVPSVQNLSVLGVDNALLKIGTVSAVTGISPATIYRKVAAGQFPKPVKDGSRCTRWVSRHVNAWLKARGGAA